MPNENGYMWIGLREIDQYGLLIVEGPNVITVYESPLHAFAQSAFNKVGLYDGEDYICRGITKHAFATELWKDFADRKEYVYIERSGITTFATNPMQVAQEFAQGFFKQKVRMKHIARFKYHILCSKWFNNGTEKYAGVRPSE